MYIKTSYTTSGKSAKLNSPMLNFSEHTCLKFFYHMYGLCIGTLRVVINGSNTVFSESGNKGNRWLEGRVNIFFSGMGTVSSIVLDNFH